MFTHLSRCNNTLYVVILATEDWQVTTVCFKYLLTALTQFIIYVKNGINQLRETNSKLLA